MSKYIRFGVSAVLLTIIAWRTNWSDVGAKFAHLDWGLWFAAVGVSACIQVVIAKRWQVFARELRFQSSLPQYCAYCFIGAYFNLLLPTSVGGDVMRVWYLNGTSGRKLAALASVFLERVNGLLVLIAMACVGVLVTPRPLPWWIHASVWSIAGASFVGAVGFPTLQRFDILPLYRRQQLQTMYDLLRVPNLAVQATLASILVQLLGVLGLWCLGLSLGLDIPVGYYCILGPLVSLLTLLPISVNGMGVREVGTVILLAPLGVDADSAKTLAFLWFAVTVAVSLLGGLVYLFGAYPRAQTTSADQGADDHGSIDRDTDQGRAGQHKQAA